MIYEVTKPQKDAHDAELESKTLTLAIDEMKRKDARFLTITAKDVDDQNVELIYHFEIDHHVESLHLITRKDKPIQSITGQYLSAFIAENEVQDLFKVSFNDLAVDLVHYR